MNLHKHQLYLLEQHSESFKIWSGTDRINTEGNSLNMTLGPELVNKTFLQRTITRDAYLYD